MSRLRPVPHLYASRLALLAAVVPLLAACAPTPGNQLEAVRAAGELVVLTRNSPTTFYEGPDGPTGFEYDLARAFADRLGVSLRMKIIDRFADILPRIAAGEADLAAAGITVTPLRAAQVRFTPYYQIIRQEVIYNARTPPPTDIRNLAGRHLEVNDGTSYIERLVALKQQYPTLTWKTVSDIETEELLLQVQEGLTDTTIADSNIAAMSRQFNTDLRVAFRLGEDEKLAWAFPPGDDNSLLEEAARFIEDMRTTGRLNQLIERHYGAATRFNPINIAAFVQKIESDLPRFRLMFDEAGRRYQLDWRLLAAVGYQESYWNPAAASSTGVRGMMMLTQTTAEHLGVHDRLDPRQSITGGAAYLRNLIDRLPERIREPDRTWMALAAYNVGLNHLEDARIITQQQGADADTWSAVKERLPLLAKPGWYTRTRHGYARGYEPVQFVTRVRTYFEVLRKTVDDSRVHPGTDALQLRAPAL